MASSEKPCQRKKRCFLDGAALFLRIWQTISASVMFTSFALLFRYIEQNRLGENSRMLSIVRLSRGVLIYTVFVLGTVHVFRRLKLPVWVVFAKLSVPGDLLMMGFLIAKITVLAVAGLPADCHGLTRENYFGDDLSRQPLDGFTTVRFGPGTLDNAGELDRLCHLPRAVYALCVADIFSYTLAIVLTVVRLQAHFREQRADEEEKPALPRGYIEGAIPLSQQRQRRSITAGEAGDVSAGSDDASSSLPTPEEENDSSPDASRSSTPSPQSRRHPDSVSLAETAVEPATEPTTPSYATSRSSASSFVAEASSSRPERVDRSDAVSWRTSQDTALSVYDPDHYLVSDGFRPAPELPAYSSRPASIRSFK